MVFVNCYWRFSSSCFYFRFNSAALSSWFHFSSDYFWSSSSCYFLDSWNHFYSSFWCLASNYFCSSYFFYSSFFFSSSYFNSACFFHSSSFFMSSYFFHSIFSSSSFLLLSLNKFVLVIEVECSSPLKVSSLPVLVGNKSSSFPSFVLLESGVIFNFSFFFLCSSSFHF